MLVATYEYPYGKVEIWDDGFAGLTQEQLIERQKQVMQISNRILDAAELRRVREQQKKPTTLAAPFQRPPHRQKSITQTEPEGG